MYEKEDANYHAKAEAAQRLRNANAVPVQRDDANELARLFDELGAVLRRNCKTVNAINGHLNGRWNPMSDTENVKEAPGGLAPRAAYFLRDMLQIAHSTAFELSEILNTVNPPPQPAGVIRSTGAGLLG